MGLIKCTKYNDTHSICKHIYINRECVLPDNDSGTILPENLSVNFPRTDRTVPVIISIIISTCIMLLLAGNMVIKIYRYRKIYRNEQKL